MPDGIIWTKRMQFPVGRLEARKIDFDTASGALSVVIRLAPFEYYDGRAACIEETSIVLSDIYLNLNATPELPGKVFIFPVNPEPGYIDGSVYIGHAHHPVDVTRIAFGEATDTGIPASFTATVVVSYEGLGDYEDTTMTFTLEIPHTVIEELRAGV